MPSTRDVPPYRDPAVILIDQLKEIYIDAELEPVDTAQWYPKVQRKDYAVALNLTGTFTDDPDAMFFENYACGGVGNYNGYCNPEIDRIIERQSIESDQEKRKHIVWDATRPLRFFRAVFPHGNTTSSRHRLSRRDRGLAGVTRRYGPRRADAPRGPNYSSRRAPQMHHAFGWLFSLIDPWRHGAPCSLADVYYVPLLQ